MCIFFRYTLYIAASLLDFLDDPESLRTRQWKVVVRHMVEPALADMFTAADLSHVCATVCSALQITSVRELARHKVFQCAPDAMYAIVLDWYGVHGPTSTGMYLGMVLVECKGLARLIVSAQMQDSVSHLSLAMFSNASSSDRV